MALALLINVQMLMADDQDGSSDVENIRKITGIQWSRISKQRKGYVEIVRDLARPYPDQGALAEAGKSIDSSIQITGTEASRIAQEFILNRSSLFVPETMGRLQPDEVPVKKVITTTYRGKYADRGTGYTVVMEQLHRGIPIFESTCCVSLTRAGQIWRVKNRLAILEVPPTIPKLSEAEALAAARAHLGDDNATSENDPQLYIYAPSKLTWRLNFLRPHFREILVDATTGNVVLSRKNVRDELLDQPLRKSMDKGPKRPSTSEPDPFVQTRFRIEGTIKVGGDCTLDVDIWTVDGRAVDVNLSADEGITVVGNATATIPTERRQWTTTVFAIKVSQQGVHQVKVEFSPVKGAASRWRVVRTLILDTEAGVVRSPTPELLSGPLAEVRSGPRSAGTAVGRTRDAAQPENSGAPKKNKKERGPGIKPKDSSKPTATLVKEEKPVKEEKE